MKLSDEEKLSYIKDMDKYIKNLSHKFVYYTKMDLEDLQQEANFKILEILKKYEEGIVTCASRNDLLKFINKSLLHHMIRIIRDFPSYEIIENSMDTLFTDMPVTFDDTTHINVDELLEHPELDDMDRDIVYLLMFGYTQQEIAHLFGVKQATIHYRLKNKIRRVIVDER